MSTAPAQHIAVIGAGIAGAVCAQALTQAGHAVQVFDKARGPGGRLATRRLEWVDRQGHPHTTRLDHGAPGFGARTPAFQAFVGQALRAGLLAAWQPRLEARSLPLEDPGPLALPVPDMPALCRHLLDGAAVACHSPVERLHRSARGWRVESGGTPHATTFDAVLLALPPAQAAPLLSLHRPDWARHASVATMRPCWTLMGIADAAEEPAPWDLLRPPTGPLAWLLRSDARPGRQPLPGQAHWVAHAKAGWSRRHLEQPAAWVQAALQDAVAECLGRPVDWLHATVHRWRYALPQAQGPVECCWWDAGLGLGVCGDFLGGQGVEGAWLSARSLSHALLQHAPAAPELQAS